MDGGAQIERRIDLPRAIVWEGLLHPVLVEGWLHPTARLLEGTVQERVDPAPNATAVLAAALEPFGDLRFELDELDGGTRGTSTLLRLRVDDAAGWEDRIDDLENLLRGHPVDWTQHPQQDRRAR